MRPFNLSRERLQVSYHKGYFTPARQNLCNYDYKQFTVIIESLKLVFHCVWFVFIIQEEFSSLQMILYFFCS